MGARLRTGAGVVVLLLAVGFRPAAADSSSVPAFTDTLRVAATERVVCLSRRFVLVSTLEIREGERPLTAGTDYEIDPDAGCITLLTPDVFGAGRVFTATYRALSLSAGVYRLREDPHEISSAGTAAAPPDAASSPGPVAYTGEEESRGLTLSGSESFGIQIGNRRDLSLDQALDLRLTGTVGHDVSLLAILSDQNLPFQPDGSTAELAELDRVLVQVESPRAGAQLGDVSLVSRGTAFLDLERELEGLTGNANVSTLQARGAVASAKGEFTTAQFFGSEGKQGPYRLTEGGGIGGGVVVAGTERVWMNGQLLARGQEEDYVIDYGVGEITFTSKRVITANSEISVDYQVASNHYRRQISFGKASGSMGSLGTLQASFFQEGDDPNRSLSGDLTAEERAQLAALGDSAVVDGGTHYVGPGLGDYQLVVDAATGSRIFRFVEGTGDYDVQFVNVGDGKGEYEAEAQAGRTVYTYVGEESGAYIPRQDLPPPARQRAADLRWDLVGEVGTLSLEGSSSNSDLNLLSSLHDGDNTGNAYLAAGSLQPIAIASGVTVTPNFTLRHADDTFRSPGRTNLPFYGRDWNLTGTQEIRGEDLQQGGLEARWGDRLVWQAEGGRLALGDTLTAVRQRQSLRWQDAWFAAGGAWLTTRNEVNGLPGNLNRKSGDVLFRRYPVQPRVSAVHETRIRDAGDSGERHRDLQLALTFPVFSHSVQGEFGGGRRQDDSLGVASGWYEARQVSNTFGQLVGSWSDLNLLLRYEARRVTGPGRPAERFDTGRLDLRHQAVQGAWTAVATANVGTIGLRRRTKSIVADSTGYYDQFGNYVGQNGGYDVRYGGQGEETLTGSVDFTSRLRWGTPSQAVSVPPLFRAFAWEGYFTLNELSTLSLSDPANFLSPHNYLDRNTTLDGRWTLRQTLDLFPSHRQLGLRLRHEANRRLISNPQADGLPGLVEVQGESNLGATVRSNPAPGWDAELEGSLGQRHDEVDPGEGIGFLQQTDLRGVTARAGKRMALVRGNGRLSAEVTYSQETGVGRNAVGWVARPRFQWFLSGWGRFDARYSRTKLTSREGFTALKGPGAPALIAGWRLDLVGELKLHRSISLTSVLAFDHPENLLPVTQGRMEVRGTF